VHPAQPVALELQPGDDRGGCRERVERAAQVGDEARCRARGAAHRPARLGLLLQDEDVPAGIGKHVRRDETVGPGTDHYGIDHAA